MVSVFCLPAKGRLSFTIPTKGYGRGSVFNGQYWLNRRFISLLQTITLIETYTGIYTVTITDAAGCVIQDSVSIGLIYGPVNSDGLIS